MLIPTDPKNAKALREFFSQQKTQLCSLGDLLGEPWSTHFNSIKAQYDGVLEKLGPTDQVPAAFDANSQLQALYSMFVSINSLTSMLSSQMDTMKRGSAAQVCSAVDAAIAEKITKGELVKAETVPVKVQEAITAKITANELVPREQHTQLCSAAKETGITEGKAAIAAEQKAAAEAKALVETRKTALQTAGLPLPETDIEKLLAGTDEEFATRQTQVKTRKDALTAKGSYNSKIGAFLWLDAERYAAFEALAADLNKKAGHEPFQQPNQPGAAPAATTFAA